MKAIVSWSGGKDSTLACYKATQQGYTISYLANTISADYRRVRFHGVKAEAIQLQSEALGIPLLQAPTTPEAYESEYTENLRQVLHHTDIAALVLGDIHLQDCYDWADNIAQKLELQLVEPLWKQDTEKLLREFIDAGFDAVIVSTQASLLGEEWVGRKIDHQFLEDIKQLPNIDICGENGEYHSFVLNGPLFKKKLTITQAEKVLRNGYWFYDLQEVTAG